MGMCGVNAYATYALLSYSIDCAYFYLQTLIHCVFSCLMSV